MVLSELDARGVVDGGRWKMERRMLRDDDPRALQAEWKESPTEWKESPSDCTILT